MPITLSPDDKYLSLVKRIDPPYEEITEFIEEEAMCCVRLKEIFDEITDQEDYESNLEEMKELASHIRTLSLNALQSNYNLFQVKKRKYIKKFRLEIER